MNSSDSPGIVSTGDDITAQATRTLENIDATLTELGLSKADICKATVWLKNAKDFPAFNKVYADYFGDVAPPARSTVQAELMDPTALIEIEMVAYLGK